MPENNVEINGTSGQGIKDNKTPDSSNQGSGTKKTFTQEQVNEIVEKRLQRERKKLEDEYNQRFDSEVNSKFTEKQSDLEARETEIQARETAVNCKEYLLKRNLPLEILEVVEPTDIDKFTEKIQKLDGMFHIVQPQKHIALSYAGEPTLTNSVQNLGKGFGRDVKHSPRFQNEKLS